MGCSGCGNGSVAVRRTPIVPPIVSYPSVESVSPCDYTVEMLNDFNNRLVWFKNRGIYKKYNVTAATLNKYMGIVLTSLNIYNKCLYLDTLLKIQDLVDLIISIQEEENV